MRGDPIFFGERGERLALTTDISVGREREDFTTNQLEPIRTGERGNELRSSHKDTKGEKITKGEGRKREKILTRRCAWGERGDFDTEMCVGREREDFTTNQLEPIRTGERGNELRISHKGHEGALNKCTAQPCRSLMPHSVAPINAAVCNKSKGAFRRPTVRRRSLSCCLEVKRGATKISVRESGLRKVSVKRCMFVLFVCVVGAG
jgi:hypothetical protein